MTDFENLTIFTFCLPSDAFYN